MPAKMMKDLFLDTLKDIYYAENKIVKSLPKMAKAAQSEELANAFEGHREETRGQIERLEKVFELCGEQPKAKTCPAIDGIIDEGEEIMRDYEDSPALDAGLIAAAQAVEHYEMSRYGTLKRWAQLMGMNDVADLLDETLEQEMNTDETLTDLAENFANDKAMKQAA